MSCGSTALIKGFPYIIRLGEIESAVQTSRVLGGGGAMANLGQWAISEEKERLREQGCQMAKFDPFLSLGCARVEGMEAQSKEREGSDFAVWRSEAIV